MMAALLVLAVACFVFWLVFFRLKIIRLTPGWGIIFAFFVVHLMLVWSTFCNSVLNQCDGCSAHHSVDPAFT